MKKMPWNLKVVTLDLKVVTLVLVQCNVVDNQ